MGHTEKAGFWNVYDRPHADLREAIQRFEDAGELLKIRGAHWKLEMGTLAEIGYRGENPPAILFEEIPWYPKGFRALAVFTDKILKGGNASTIPIEQARRIGLTLNMSAAKALGLKVPPALLARADRVIE